MTWNYAEIDSFVTTQTGEKTEREVEGPAILGPYSVWRVWTFNGEEYNAHYVVGKESSKELTIFENFQPFANWLMIAFNVKDSHARHLDWLRSIVASIITLTLLGLVVWAVLNHKTGVDFKWLVGALATTALGYLLGGWVRRTP